MDAFHLAKIPVDAPCGGHGTCGKCLVRIKGDSVSGLLKACLFSVTEDIQVELPETSQAARILETGSGCHMPFTSSRSEASPRYVLACDIGTTTVVSYLLDRETGEQLAVSSCLNPQTSYGADIISRCSYAQDDTGLTLSHLIRRALDQLAAENARKAGISAGDISFAAIVGNTCMQHLFLGISPDSLLYAPYTSTADELQLLPASSFDLHFHPNAMVAVLPSISGFVGADTVGVLLSLPASAFDCLTLILDIGTNGELVLGRGDTRFTCSTAAGPAFEGANIACGMRGAPGAVDHVTLQQGELHISVIDNIPPAGICGSGLLDLVCCLLDLGIISPDGRMQKPEKWLPDAASRYSSLLIQKDDIAAFLLPGTDIYLTQKDIREVQLAKAAIATGIELLCDQMQVPVTDIQSVLLAGAFGNYMWAESACRIGLIPASLQGRIHAIGNAAGEGAKIAALDRGALSRCEELARTTRFVELAASEKFQTTYFDHLNFPDVSISPAP
jgi:uncharacterized 2Fe-2S/4Fe-4S cluster protein (DUF4445 family)